MKAALQNYHARLQRVIDYIDQHLDGDLDVETVSRVAAFSKFHFHRQFTATFELPVHRYVQLGLCCKDDRRRWEDGDKLDPISFMRRYRKER
jgi:AraC family transcriptional regulator